MSSSNLAILLPGHLDSPDYPHLVQLDKDLTKLGYQVIRITPKGTWEPGADISQYSMTHTLEQIDQITKQHQDYQIIIAGHSLGGTISLISAINNSSVTAAISIMGPSSFVRPERYQERVVGWKQLPYKISTRDLPEDPQQTREFRLPYSFIEDALKYQQVLDRLDTCTQPLLFIAGEVDSHFSPDHIKSQFNLAKEPKKFVIIKGVGHDYRKRPEEIELVNREVITFLQEQHLA